MPLISGCFLVLMLLQNQDGIAKETGRQARWAQERLNRRARRPEKAPALPPAGEPTVRPAGAVLEARDLTVKFGGVTAVNKASFRLEAGQIVGLIGPNGAGKTTLIDAVTGFVKTASGTIELDGRPIEGWPAQRRAREFGEVISEGPPHVVRADPLVISAYLGEPQVEHALEIP